MTTESVRRIDLNVLPIKDLARQAQREIKAFENESNNAISPVIRAVRNIVIIDRIRESDAVQVYLKSTNTVVHFLSYGWDKRKTGIIVSAEGFSLRWHEGYATDAVSWHTSPCPIDNKEIARNYKSGSPRIRTAFKRLAKLKPEQIIKKFEKAVTKSIKVK